jgi:RNA polymerase sigma factor (sigma-70 family)
VVDPDQTMSAQAVASPVPEIWPPTAPDGYEEFYRDSFRDLVRTAMYYGAIDEEARDAACKALIEMLEHWDRCKGSLAYARKAAVHNFIKAKTRGTDRVARRLVERGHVPLHEGAEDGQLTAVEDKQWVASVLSSLPPAQREVMELLAEGLNTYEIAEILGKTQEAVRKNLSYACARLRRELHPDGEPRQNPPARTNNSPQSVAHSRGRRPDDHP